MSITTLTATFYTSFTYFFISTDVNNSNQWTRILQTITTTGGIDSTSGQRSTIYGVGCVTTCSVTSSSTTTTATVKAKEIATIGCSSSSGGLVVHPLRIAAAAAGGAVGIAIAAARLQRRRSINDATSGMLIISAAPELQSLTAMLDGRDDGDDIILYQAE